MFSLRRRWPFFVLGLVFGVMVVYGIIFHPMLYQRNVVDKGKPIFIHIPREATFKTVMDTLKRRKIFYDFKSFTRAAQLVAYPSNIHSGRYELKPNWSNYKVLKTLKSGSQTPVNLMFTSVRTKDKLAYKISKQLSFKTDEFLKFYDDPKNAKKYEFTSETFILMFIPNTYEVYWDIYLPDFFKRMNKEYQKFWNKEQKQKAKNLGLTPIEVGILASIVEAETNNNTEKPRIAGVYLNRLNKGMLLQADPTVKFALGDFSIKRILHEHLEVESRYNTYKHLGLPPGPINCPSIASINAVLNAEKHDFIYFCAKPDYSGTHVFAKNLDQHNRNAKKYHKFLNSIEK